MSQRLWLMILVGGVLVGAGAWSVLVLPVQANSGAPVVNLDKAVARHDVVAMVVGTGEPYAYDVHRAWRGAVEVGERVAAPALGGQGMTYLVFGRIEFSTTTPKTKLLVQPDDGTEVGMIYRGPTGCALVQRDTTEAVGGFDNHGHVQFARRLSKPSSDISTEGLTGDTLALVELMAARGERYSQLNVDACVHFDAIVAELDGATW